MSADKKTVRAFFAEWHSGHKKTPGGMLADDLSDNIDIPMNSKDIILCFAVAFNAHRIGDIRELAKLCATAALSGTPSGGGDGPRVHSKTIDRVEKVLRKELRL